MKRLITILFCFLLFAPAAQSSIQVPEKEVCAAALSTILDVKNDRRFDRIATDGTQTYFVFKSRKRPANSDGCYITKNRIYWRVESASGIKKGRWRTDPADDKVTFHIAGDIVTIKLNHGDGSITSELHSLKALAKSTR